MNCFGKYSGKMCHMNCKIGARHRIKRILGMTMVVLAAVYVCLCVSMCLTIRNTAYAQEDGMLFYIVNADGMKGLGHSIVLLVDEDGYGTVISFNGMQRTLIESLLGKSGIGKMNMEAMTQNEVETFLQTGILRLEGDQLSDHYDMALYRPITIEQYYVILEGTLPYIAAELQFADLYEKWAMEEDAGKKEEYHQALEQMGQNESLPLYQIYTNNCDHVARMLASSVDEALQEDTLHTWRMTPNGNFKVFGKKAENWGVMTLGEQSLWEKILMFLVIF